MTKKEYTPLTLSRYYLTCDPLIAYALGLNEALIINRLDYLIALAKKDKRHYQNGCIWVYNSYEQWHTEHFPFMSESTIRRTFNNLERQGIIESCQWPSCNRTKNYTLHYEVLEQIIDAKLPNLDFSSNYNKNSRFHNETVHAQLSKTKTTNKLAN